MGHLVYVPYCDGTSFSGDAEVDGLHFRGKTILNALLAELKGTVDVQSAEQVVITGGSAGASAVFYHVDEIVETLALTGGEVVALPDAGFFLDRRDKDGIDCWPNQMQSIWNVSNGYAALRASNRSHGNVFTQNITQTSSKRVPLFCIVS